MSNIYIRTATFLFYHCICQKQKPKIGVVFVVDGGGDAGECWHQRQPTGPHWADPAMFGFVKQCWMYVLLRSYMSACLSLCPSVCLCVFVCCFAFSSLQFFKHGFFFSKGPLGINFLDIWLTLFDVLRYILFCTFKNFAVY